jgi:hypothetical protein
VSDPSFYRAEICAGCHGRLDPVIGEQGWDRHPGCIPWFRRYLEQHPTPPWVPPPPPPPVDELHTCPGCGKTATEPTRTPHTVHRTLCMPCTEREIGCTFHELRARINALMLKAAKKRKWRLV